MINCFERVEKKYVITKHDAISFLDIIAPHIMKDTYSHYTICNLYYDTDHYDLVRQSIEKPPYKEKMRIRSYGTVSATDPIFIELKKKYEHVVFKRRITCSTNELRHFMEEPLQCFEDTQIAHEISYFMHFYQPFPKLYIAYDRHAYKGIYEDDLRITFDHNLRYREDDLTLERDYGKPYFKEDTIIMEIKVQHAFPLWLTHVLNQMMLYPTSFSKYGNIYRQYLAPMINQEEYQYV